jgi:hypothetical protein
MRRVPDPIFPLLLSILAAALLFGCATPAPLVRLHPNTGEDVFWMSGRAAVKKQSGGVQVAAAFEHQLGKRLGLRVEVRNGTGERIEINPDFISFVTCAGEDDSSCSDYKRVVDPEQVIESLDARRSREIADAADDRALNTAMVFLSAVGDVAEIASGKTSPTTGLQTDAIATRGDNAESNHHRALSDIAARRALWADAALRRSTLEPGDGVAGFVYIPYRKQARYVWLQVSTGDRDFTFCFRQTTRRVQ